MTDVRAATFAHTVEKILGERLTTHKLKLIAEAYVAAREQEDNERHRTATDMATDTRASVIARASSMRGASGSCRSSPWRSGR